MENKYLASWLLVLLSLILGVLAYPALPPSVASHWGISGQVNGYQSRAFAVLFMPALMAVLVGLFWVLPKLDPLGKNIRRFRSVYERFVLILVTFLAYVHTLTLVWNIGFKFNIIRFLIPAFGLFIFELGRVLPSARPNWFFGIRTPWTLSNGRVWYRTHLLAGKLYKLAGILSLGGFIWPRLAVYFLLIPILSVSLSLVVYSYFDWRQSN